MPPAQRLKIEYVPIHLISPAERNPKGHDIAGIKASIRRHGFVEPELIDARTGRLLAGHGRLETLDEMHAENPDDPPKGIVRKRSTTTGQAAVWLAPTISVHTASDHDAEALLVALNRLPESGGWNVEGLSEILTSLRAGADLQIDLSGLAGTGYTEADHDAILASLAPKPEPDQVNDADTDVDPDAPTRVNRGDVWEIDGHRLMCGDCRNPAEMGHLIGSRYVQLAFTSPPYASQRKYDPASGFLPIKPDEYVEWFAPVADNVRMALAPEGSWFVNIRAHCEDGQRHLYVHDLVAAHVREWGWRFVDDLVWRDLKNGVPGSWPNRFKDAWEPVYHFARDVDIVFNPTANATPTDQAVIAGQAATHTGFTVGSSSERGAGLALPSNVIEIASSSGTAHEAAFPPALPAWFIRAFSHPGDYVLDPFSGSGSTLVAAHNENRGGLGMELSPRFCDLTLDRLERHTGEKAVLTGTFP